MARPAVPVNAGEAVSSSEEANRQSLLKRSLPADLLETDTRIEEEYKVIVQEQAPGLRAMLPPDVPEPFHAERYYPVLTEVMRQREEEEEMEHLIATLPVHPKDGGVDLADLQQRRQWIQQLKQEDLPQVSKLLHE